MNNKVTSVTLASYAMIKALTDSNEYRSQYEILAEFIKYIIVKYRLKSFQLVDVQNYLNSEFTFTIPQAAIKTALKKVIAYRKNGEVYTLENQIDDIGKISALQEETGAENRILLESLYEYANRIEDDIQQQELEEAFVKYIIDDSISQNRRYVEIISKFLIEHDNDLDFQRQIKEIREGSILYCGLAYNMSELGSLRDGLTLFLDTEVIFNIVGYNGQVYQMLADDLLTQVKAANVGQTRIKLRFFREVKEEIDAFFRSAEFALMGKGELIQSIAMGAILNGCTMISDVRAKHADFYHKLRTEYGIIPDEKADYYSANDYDFNIESIPEGFEKDEKSFEAIKYISHINVLRKGISTEDYTKCKYLLITETRRIQEMANALQDDHTCKHAMPTSAITNILWLKLGSGFSKKEYPANTDIILKARGIISGTLSSAVFKAYEDVKKQYLNGDVTKEQLADRIILFREKIQCSESIDSDNMDDLLDFSPEAIEKYEQGRKANSIQLSQQKEIIKQLEETKEAGIRENAKLKDDLAQASEELSKKEKELLSSNHTIERKNEIITAQNIELNKYRQQEMESIKRKTKFKKDVFFVLGLLLIAGSMVGLVILSHKILERINPVYIEAYKYVIDGIGFIAFIWSAIGGLKKLVYGKVAKGPKGQEDSSEETTKSGDAANE